MYLKTSKGTLKVLPEVSDEKLMARYRRGDFEAMDELVRRYEKPLFSFLWRMSGNGADVQEIFQEVWLRVIAKARDFKQKRFKGWIFTIARNLVIDTSRRQKKLVSLDEPTAGGAESDMTLADRLVSREPGPDYQVDGHDTRSAIDQALMGLPREQREVFIMRMESNLTFREISEVLGIPLNTCLARMQYALGKMRTRLKTYHPEANAEHEL